MSAAASAPAVVERVPARGWRGVCADALAAGLRFGGLFAAAGSDGPEVRVVFGDAGGERVFRAGALGGALPTIVDLVPAAGWDEREAHEVAGVRFEGHEPLRPLLDHGAGLDAWTVPVHGRDVNQVAVGPIHAGVIESGHFRFHGVGERILHLDVRLFHKRRGLERAAQGRPLAEGLAYAQRACGACAVTNAVAYAQACEAALGLWPDRELRRARTLLLELERLYNHLNDIGAICAGVGFAPGTMTFAALKERAHRLIERLAGHRFLFGTVALGASELRIGEPAAREARAELRDLRAAQEAAWRGLAFATSVQERLAGVGVLAAADAERLGATGPALRAAGVRRDARAASPRLWYSGFAPALPGEPVGDVAARLEMRAAELPATFDLLEGLLGGEVAPGRAQAGGTEGDTGIARVESPRGETVCVVERDGDRLARLHLRTGSYANWPALAYAVPGNLLPDFPLINKSFELCYACVDR